uniref:Baseplate component n=1 Tax=Siphoviridae sp. ctFPV4 TaxID=2827819 RepID=A0A8S5SKJ0_9CAUD|nr:MAG TPA: Baseplate component [Siphoviridae sp. ctFPV4]
MQVTKNITLDLLETGSPVIIKAKQNDRNTRYIAAHLYVDGLAYPVPSGTEIAFRYKKPDGTAGFYDTLPDNSPAITVSGNTVTVELVEQVLTVSGCVHCEINMYNAASEKLTTFTFEISVEESVLTDAEIISSDYYNVLTAEIAKALQAVTDATEQAENAAQSAQDAADSAAMSKDWAAGKPVTYSGAPVSIAYAGTNRIASITAYGDTPQGGTTEAPVALTGVDSVQVCGKNMLPNKTKTNTVAGITYTVNPDKSVTAKGTATSWSNIVIDADFSLPAGTYTLNSNIQTAGVNLVIGKDTTGKKNIAVSSTASQTFTLSDSIKHCVAYIAVAPDSVVDTTIRPMLNLGKTAMPCEPYQGNVTQLPIPRPLRRVGDVRDVCVTRQEYEGTEKLVVTYNVGFVELDGTEAWNWNTSLAWAYISTFLLNNKTGIAPACSHYQGTGAAIPAANQVAINELGSLIIKDPSWKSVDDAKAYLAAQKEAGTPVQVAYQLATPETYATDPVDFDNAAGPLTVMTGGEVEVRMTELVGTRSPELTGKMDRDIYFQVGNLNLGDNTNLLNPVNQQGQASYTGDSTSPYCIDRWRISNGTTYNIVSRTLTASSYANRACGMWQTNELAQQALAIGSTITFSGYINGMQHSGTIKILNRDLYSSFAEVPAGYECDDFEIVCCTASHEQSKYNLGIYPKKEAVLNWIKWEKGLYATPYAPKGFGLEQLECMRYYQTIKGIKYVLRKALASEGFPYVIPVTFMPMRAVPQTDITVTEGAENNLTATGVTQTACGIQFQPVAENVGLTFTLTLSANL